ncbi:hypothetical protein KY334_00885 [Candidatus Woesearchaeota archaeon]|nr:hypothetical protein [Candidatus Woesearchaeota archaeon]
MKGDTDKHKCNECSHFKPQTMFNLHCSKYDIELTYEKVLTSYGSNLVVTKPKECC